MLTECVFSRAAVYGKIKGLKKMNLITIRITIPVEYYNVNLQLYVQHGGMDGWAGLIDGTSPVEIPYYYY